MPDSESGVTAARPIFLIQVLSGFAFLFLSILISVFTALHKIDEGMSVSMLLNVCLFICFCSLSRRIHGDESFVDDFGSNYLSFHSPVCVPFCLCDYQLLIYLLTRFPLLDPVLVVFACVPDPRSQGTWECTTGEEHCCPGHRIPGIT